MSLLAGLPLYKNPFGGIVMIRFMMTMLFVLLLAPLAFADGIGDPSTIERITPVQLKARMDSGDRIVIIDARSSGAYNYSDSKIKGDIRIAPDEIIGRARELPMGAEIIIYCT